MLASGEGGGVLEGEGNERWAERKRQNSDCLRRPSIFVFRFSFFFTGWHVAQTGDQMWRQQDETETLRKGSVAARRGDRALLLLLLALLSCSSLDAK